MMNYPGEHVPLLACLSLTNVVPTRSDLRLCTLTRSFPLGIGSESLKRDFPKGALEGLRKAHEAIEQCGSVGKNGLVVLDRGGGFRVICCCN